MRWNGVDHRNYFFALPTLLGLLAGQMLGALHLGFGQH